MTLLTIFCGGFLDDFDDNFLRQHLKTTLLTLFYGFLFCFICSTKFVHAVQKSAARFEGVCVKLGWEGGCKSYSMDSLLLSKIIRNQLV
jgi:hypothetical protein